MEMIFNIKNYTIIISITFFIIILSCNKFNKPTFRYLENYSSIDKIQNLKYTTIELKGEEIDLKFGSIQDIVFIDNSLVLLDIKSDYYFNSLTIPSYQLVNSKITNKSNIESDNGENSFSKIINSNYDYSLRFFDFNKKNISDYFPQKDTVQLVYKLRKDHFTIQSGLLIDDSLFAYVDGENNYLSFYNMNQNKTININIMHPLIVNDNHWYPNDLALNENNKLIITWNIISNELLCFDFDGKLKKIYSFSSNNNIKKNNKLSKKYAYYYKLKSKGDFIYSLYAGFNVMDNIVNSVLENLKSQIHIINLKTNAVYVFKLDRLVNCIDIDFNNKIIYAVQEGGNENKPIVKYVYEMEIL